MDHRGNAHHFPAIDSVQAFNQMFSVETWIERVSVPIDCDESSLFQILNDGLCFVPRNVQRFTQFIERPPLRPAIPEQQQRLQVRHTIDFVENKLVNFLSSQVVFCHRRVLQLQVACEIRDRSYRYRLDRHRGLLRLRIFSPASPACRILLKFTSNDESGRSGRFCGVRTRIVEVAKKCVPRTYSLSCSYFWERNEADLKADMNSN